MTGRTTAVDPVMEALLPSKTATPPPASKC